ncbi:MAG: hypothetical protein SGI84_09705 [Gemmatimonadota bacterium]|nr:hypothetical protein [Gemmatimonadota bacterium]
MDPNQSAIDQLVIFIDKQQFKLDRREYTARELLLLAGEDPGETTLAEKHGNELIKHADLDKPIQLRNGMHFVVLHNGPTTVS